MSEWKGLEKVSWQQEHVGAKRIFEGNLLFMENERECECMKPCDMLGHFRQSKCDTIRAYHVLSRPAMIQNQTMSNSGNYMLVYFSPITNLQA